MQILQGKRLVKADAETFRSLREGYPSCLIDIGTGDGLFPYRHAREHPDCLTIGIDPVTDALKKLAVKAQRKITKGGAPNLLLIQSSLEELPGLLAGSATALTVNFPWGGLLRALVEPAPKLLKNLAAVGAPGAAVTLLINVSIFGDEDYLRRQALPSFAEDRVQEDLVPVYRECGIELTEIQALAGAVPHRTSWGQRLVRGSARRSLLLRGYTSSPATGPIPA
ncbi:MAG: hypothetical protein K0U98_22615 [Deltaproteobacteria bacterium]|nr:hypothetical protein [Deltaproteobacteria bacterium]